MTAELNERPRSATLGVWSFALSLVILVWFAVVVALAIAALPGDPTLVSIAAVLGLGSFAVVPIFALVTLLTGIVALAVGSALGKIFGALGILMIIAQAISIILFFASGADLLVFTQFGAS